MNNKDVGLPFKMYGKNLELAILSQAIVNSDDLVQKVNSLVQENRRLKQKYKSLSHSAVQVKQLYEQERDMCLKTRSQNTELKNKIAGLIARNKELDHFRINMQLTHAQAIAELEMKNHQESIMSNNILKELVFQCKLWSEGDPKLKGVLRQAIDLLDKKGVDVDKFKLDKSKGRSKGRQKKDDELMNIQPVVCSTDFEKIEPVQFLDMQESLMKVKVFDKTDIGAQIEQKTEKDFCSIATNTEKKTYCDKSTAYTCSTITRGVSTENFIKKIDVGTNFPDLTTLSIADILKEMIIETPLLLSPISDAASTISQPTQTMSIISNQPDFSSKILNRIKTRTKSTYTRLKNIRKPIDYCLSPQNVSKNIKIEALENKFDTLNVTSEQDINPHLTQLWIILGKLLFGLIGNGQIFNNSTATVNVGKTWQKIQEISELIEGRSSQHQEFKKAYNNVVKGIETRSNCTNKKSFETEVEYGGKCICIALGKRFFNYDYFILK